MKNITAFRGEYSFLSNFYRRSFILFGVEWPTVEHAFQAQKATSREDFVRFIADVHPDSPGDAKALGRKIELRPDWEDIKVAVMRSCVTAKFQQNYDLLCKLIATGDVHIEEGNNWGDRFWGTVNGEGSNMLGFMLMATRANLRWAVLG